MRLLKLCSSLTCLSSPTFVQISHRLAPLSSSFVIAHCRALTTVYHFLYHPLVLPVDEPHKLFVHTVAVFTMRGRLQPMIPESPSHSSSCPDSLPTLHRHEVSYPGTRV
eukprot:GHVN01033580.1.p1 GENE.GHVN01033580.1~~GHVN01033580.1.p1  ORF type:complete len:109 (+),score=0.54 GHVN01033580.1:609-935(+)